MPEVVNVSSNCGAVSALPAQIWLFVEARLGSPKKVEPVTWPAHADQKLSYLLQRILGESC
jgi:hypothetical protein